MPNHHILVVICDLSDKPRGIGRETAECLVVFEIVMHKAELASELVAVRRLAWATRRKHTLASSGKERTAQAHALDLVAPWQPSTRSSPTKAADVVIQQAGHGPGLGAEGNLAAPLDLQVSALGQDLLGLLVLASAAQPFRAYEESSSHVTRP